MKVLEPGHIYVLNWIDGDPLEDQDVLTFVNREPGTEHAGTQTQEVLRALIDRTYHCNNCLPHYLNEKIIYHLRMALVCHEMRAMERHVVKGQWQPEFCLTGEDGHFVCMQNTDTENWAERNDKFEGD